MYSSIIDFVTVIIMLIIIYEDVFGDQHREVIIHVCIAFFRCSNVSPSHLEKLIARNKCPVRPDRNAFRKTRYHSAIPFNYKLL